MDFEIIETYGGIVEDYSSSHKVIIYNISGKDFSINYSLKSPQIFLSRDYIFNSEIENYKINSSKAIVYFLVPLFPIKVKPILRNKTSEIKAIIFPDKPFVLRFNEGNIIRIGLYPNKKIVDAQLKIIPFNKKPPINNGIEYYYIKTNVRDEDLSKIYIEFRVKKSVLNLSKHYNATIYYLDNLNNYSEGEFISSREDNQYQYYRYVIPNSKEFLIAKKDRIK